MNEKTRADLKAEGQRSAEEALDKVEREQAKDPVITLRREFNTFMLSMGKIVHKINTRLDKLEDGSVTGATKTELFSKLKVLTELNEGFLSVHKRLDELEAKLSVENVDKA